MKMLRLVATFIGLCLASGCILSPSNNSIQPIRATLPVEERQSAAALSVTLADTPAIQLTQINTAIMREYDFTDIGCGVWTGYAESVDRNGVFLESLPLMILSSNRVDINNDGRTNISDVVIMVRYLFRK